MACPCRTSPCSFVRRVPDRSNVDGVFRRLAVTPLTSAGSLVPYYPSINHASGPVGMFVSFESCWGGVQGVILDCPGNRYPLLSAVQANLYVLTPAEYIYPGLHTTNHFDK